MKESSGQLFTQLTLEVFKLSGLLNNEGDELTKEFGITSSRWKILGAIATGGGALTVPQIARAMGQSRQAVQRLVDIMIKDGFLVLVDNPNHKRAKLISMTTLAQEVYQHLYDKQIPWAESCSRKISKKDLDTALKVIQQVSKNLIETQA